MEKFIGQVRAPINFHSASVQAKYLRDNPEYLEVKVAVVNGRVFTNTEKHQAGVTSVRTVGGKWVERKPSKYQTLEQYMEHIGAKPATFRGGPRVK